MSRTQLPGGLFSPISSAGSPRAGGDRSPEAVDGSAELTDVGLADVHAGIDLTGLDRVEHVGHGPERDVLVVGVFGQRAPDASEPAQQVECQANGGGKVKVESEPQVGSTFTVWLPTSSGQA